MNAFTFFTRTPIKLNKYLYNFYDSMRCNKKGQDKKVLSDMIENNLKQKSIINPSVLECDNHKGAVSISDAYKNS